MAGAGDSVYWPLAPWPPGSQAPWPRLRELPPGTVLPLEELVRIQGAVAVPGGVRDAHVRAVVQDLPLRAERDDAEEHHFRQRPGVLERAGDLRLALDRLHPVHL